MVRVARYPKAPSADEKSTAAMVDEMAPGDGPSAAVQSVGIGVLEGLHVSMPSLRRTLLA